MQTYLRLLYLFKRISTFVPDAYRWFDQGVAQHVSADEYEDYEITSREQRSGVAAELEQVLQALLRGQSPISGQPLASGPHPISILVSLPSCRRHASRRCIRRSQRAGCLTLARPPRSLASTTTLASRLSRRSFAPFAGTGRTSGESGRARSLGARRPGW